MEVAKLQAELEQSKAEIVRLRERMSMCLPTVHKDLSLISLIPKWPGSESAVPLQEFLASVDSAARIGNWDQRDCLEIAALKLADTGKSFHNTCLELQAEGTTWGKFKEVFRHRFRDVHTDQYRFMRLQTTRQAKNAGPQEFAGRCRALAQIVMCKDSDPVAQRIQRENAERMLLASFVPGLSGVAGRQVRYQNPQTLQPALSIALSERWKRKKDLKILFTRRLTSRSASNPGRPIDRTLRGIALGAQLTLAKVTT